MEIGDWFEERSTILNSLNYTGHTNKKELKFPFKNFSSFLLTTLPYYTEKVYLCPAFLRSSLNMDALKQYSIPIEGLKNGMHQFDFQIDKSFFDHFEESPVKEGNLTLQLYFEKHQDHSVFTFDFAGSIRTDCDRCLEAINLPLKGSEQLIVKYADQEDEEAEVIFIQRGTRLINVAKYAYEFICLAIPIIKVYDCENEDPIPCNEAILDNLYKEEEIKEKTNPAWEALKNFKKK